MAVGDLLNRDLDLVAWHRRRQQLIPYDEPPPIEERRQAMLTTMRDCCTCHPDEAPVPCQRLHALSDCIKASQMSAGQKLVQIMRNAPKPQFDGAAEQTNIQLAATYAIEELMRSNWVGPLAQSIYDETLYFSMEDQVLYCALCRRAVDEQLNSAMRWPNDIHGYAGHEVAEIEEDGFGPITSRSRWLTPGSSTDYR